MVFPWPPKLTVYILDPKSLLKAEMAAAQTLFYLLYKDVISIDSRKKFPAIILQYEALEAVFPVTTHTAADSTA